MLPLLLSLSIAGCTANLPCPDSIRVPILVYHNVEPGSGKRDPQLFMRPEVFAEQMQYLEARGIKVVSLGALVDALEGKGTVPQPAVVITFDDGRVNQYEHAYPVLRKHRFPATFFPFTHAIGRNPRYFTWAQLKEMQAAGMTIGSHTNLHVRVTRIRDPKEWHKEVKASRDVLEEKLGAKIEYFAYPFGALSASGDSAVRASGYRAARAFSGGAWNRPGNLVRLNAVPMTEDMGHFRRTVDPAARTSPVAGPGAGGRGTGR